MKCYNVNLGAGLAGLTLMERDEPKPKHKEIVVRVRATSLNFRELMILRGKYPLPVKPDVIPVSDGAGEVVAIGTGVTRVKIGDRVAGTVFPQWIDGRFGWEFSKQLGGSLDGMLTEFAVLDEDGIVLIPEHLSFDEAATLPCAALTAWNALTGGRPLSAGETILTLGSGGVSLFAIQFAKLFGTRVIATTSDDDKAKRLKILGADEVINYNTTPDWHIAVRELTNNRGVDHVIEVGGGGTLEKSIKSTAIEGEIAMVGWLTHIANDVPTLNLNTIAANVVTLRRIAIGNRAQFLSMNRAIETNKMKPVIDRVFQFDDAIAAFRYLEQGKYFGKVVISGL
jgi:NADPH:quinone reductase-like Zn-dependent oxidoreductase